MDSNKTKAGKYGKNINRSKIIIEIKSVKIINSYSDTETSH